MRRTVTSVAVVFLLSFAAMSIRGAAKAKAGKTAGPKTAAAASYGNADAIREDELKVYDYFLASDQLEGRSFPSRGYDTAALYVASHLAEWGLKPGGSSSGTNGPLQPYLMPIELVSKQAIPEDSKASLSGVPAGDGRGGFGGGQGGEGRGGPGLTLNFEYGKDWIFGTGAGVRGPQPDAIDISAGLVFAGDGYVINKTKINPYAGLDVKGKIVVVAGQPAELAAQAGGSGRGGRGRGGRGEATANQPEQSTQELPPARGANAPNPLGEACVDFLTPEQYAAKNGALAVVTIASFQQLAAMANLNVGRGGALNGPPFQVKKFQPASACPSAPSITAGLAFTNALFQGEKQSGQQIFYGAGNNAKLDSFELSDRKKLSLHLAVHVEDGHGENVVGILEGSDPVLKNEFVVMSAHLDHIGLSAPVANGHNVNNGADDDGSGSAGLLAIARAYAEGAAKGMRPRRSILFLWNGGEEKGLWGSQYFNQFPPIDLSRVVADLNMDMIGRTKNANSVDSNKTHLLVNPGELLVVGPNISSDDLEETIESVNANYRKLALNHFYDTTAPDATHDNLGPQPNGQRVFYRSDHYNFAKMGIPIAFFTTGLHVDYHRPTDTPEKIDFREILEVSRTVAAIGWELSNQNGRPKLKADLPEQLVKDMKAAEKQGWGKVTPVLAPLPGEPY
jgi:Zn-dependent M28 family amino/carboxypeptidase